jgi:hypothetical protein
MWSKGTVRCCSREADGGGISRVLTLRTGRYGEFLFAKKKEGDKWV